MVLRYGGDYNPELTPESVWDEDIRLMKQARVNLVTVGVFSWALLEPRDGEFEFGWLDRILDKLHAAGIAVDLATATASPPPWLSVAHPETLPEDMFGVRSWPGSRQAYAPTSPIYLAYSRRLVRQMAERYATHPAVVLWHINNELGAHTNLDYGPAAEVAFRTWLQQKYGTIERLNEVWFTQFWSQRYDAFSQVRPPRKAPNWRNPAQLLDFQRFSSDALLSVFLGEKEIVKAVNPDIPVLTNFIGAFKPVNYQQFAPHVDLVSDDSYPDPLDPRSPMLAAFARDLMRSLSGGAPWLLLEQAAGYVNWRPVNTTKRRGQMRAWSLQAVSRGADGIMFFQIRQSRAGAEKFHSGMLPHSGERSRVWRSVVELGADLERISAVEGQRATESRVAILFDWEAWWAIEEGSKPTPIDYYENVIRWYQPLYQANVQVDIIHPSHDLDQYSVLVLPNLYLLSEADATRIAAFVQRGGRLVATYLTGIVDENDHVAESGYLRGLESALGVWIDDFAALAKGAQAGPTSVDVTSETLGDFRGTEWSEYIEVTTAEVVARFCGLDVDGLPAVTRNRHGAGEAWYVATMPDDRTIARIIDGVRRDAGVAAVVEGLPGGVEAARRGDHLFIINQTDAGVVVDVPGRDLLSGRAQGPFDLGPFEALVLTDREES